ncbi:MAG: NAD(P)H-dependent oxidoreductase [Lachnospiraceae bacterium]|nr:NAD(P)H-dependent oxidoreductase [Lachnospiraceae bacterium]
MEKMSVYKSKILILDACVRKEQSRTKRLLDYAVKIYGKTYEEAEMKHLVLEEMPLSYHTCESLAERDRLLQKGQMNHPRFDLAHEFAQADGIIVAAPFWDMGIPAVLKVYLENISVEGITFGCNEKGLYGLCGAKWMLYLSTRGSICGGTPLEQGTPYLAALCDLFGIPKLESVSAEGLDIFGIDVGAKLAEAEEKICDICTKI